MKGSRRHFLKQVAGVLSVLLGGTQLFGCFGESDTQQSTATPLPTESGSAAASQPAAQAISTQTSANTGPVWQPSPSIEFVEGVPAMVSIRDFVYDKDLDQVVITLNSGTLLPGITWNPTNATLAYDGRPLGAKPDAPVMLTGVTFAADDQKN